jgi:hypothetical protein
VPARNGTTSPSTEVYASLDWECRPGMFGSNDESCVFESDKQQI